MNRTSSRKAGAQDHEVPLILLNDRLRLELVQRAEHSAEIQRALSLCHLELAGVIDAEAIRGLQRIDRVTQTLEDLAEFMAALCASLPRDLRVNADPLLARLRLKELADALDPDHPPATQEDRSSGEILWL